MIDIRKVVINADSPVVFCHYDTQMCNLMRTYPNLTWIDYDFAGYLPRGFEFGQFFTEMAFERTKDYLMFRYVEEDYPTRDYQMEFFNAYIERITANGKKRGIKFHAALKDLDDVALEYETNVCALLSAIYNIAYCVVYSTDLKTRGFGAMVIFTF